MIATGEALVLHTFYSAQYSTFIDYITAHSHIETQRSSNVYFCTTDSFRVSLLCISLRCLT
jgi:hypothetical protein